MVDPQFLPTILTSPNATKDGRFGARLAMSGSSLVLAAPGEEVYYQGLETYGVVYLENTVTWVTTMLTTPPSVVQSVGAGFGFSVAIGGGRIVVGAPGQNSSSGAVYVYSASSGSFETYYTSPNAQYYNGLNAGGAFGNSVAVSGNLIVVGAPEENYSGVGFAGHAYIINALTGATTMLSSPSPQYSGWFGASVAISGNTVVVGAPGEETLGTDYLQGGNVYVFSATTGDMITSLSSRNTVDGGFFGTAVAINGSIIVVGAPYETAGVVPEAGNAYTFNLLTGAVTTLGSEAPVTFGDFGQSVAVNAGTIVVGAPGETSGGSRFAGDAYLFSTGSGELITSEFVPPDWPISGYFGSAVTENTSAVVVGAPYENASGYVDAGHAFLFTHIPLTYASLNSQERGYFGSAVSISGGFVAIGADNETVGDFAGAGRVYLSAGLLGPVETFVSPSPQTLGFYGAAVAVAPPILAVGEPGYDGDDGAVYLYNTTTGALTGGIGSTVYADMGSALAISGHALVVGEDYLQIGPHYYAGGALVLNTSTSVQTPLADPAPQGSAFFGASVAVSGTLAVVGAPGYNGSVGAAYVFNASTGTLLETLANPVNFTGLFGLSVAIHGSTVVVGAPYENGAFLFSAKTGALLMKLNDPAPQPVNFGISVAYNGGTIVVGASGETAFGIAYAGNVYLYNGAGAVLDRYNSPNPYYAEFFGSCVAIGPGGIIVVGESPSGFTDSSGNAYAFFF